MARESQKFCITRGDKFSILVRVTDSAGAALDLTAAGYTPRMDLRATPNSDTVIASFAASVGGLSNNEITLTLDATQTAAVEVDSAEGRVMLQAAAAEDDQILGTRYLFTFDNSPTRR